MTFFHIAEVPYIANYMGNKGVLEDTVDMWPFAKQSSFSEGPFTVENRKRNVCCYERSIGTFSLNSFHISCIINQCWIRIWRHLGKSLYCVYASYTTGKVVLYLVFDHILSASEIQVFRIYIFGDTIMFPTT